MANVKSRLDEALTEQSKYCYPNTDVLINKLGITNQEDLDIAERYCRKKNNNSYVDGFTNYTIT